MIPAAVPIILSVGSTLFNMLGSYQKNKEQDAIRRENIRAQNFSNQAQYLQNLYALNRAKHEQEIRNLNLRASSAAHGLNAKNAELAALSALMNGQQQKAMYTNQAGNTLAKQRVALAANGVVMDEGNAREIQNTAELMKHIDAQTIINNSIKDSWGYKSQALNERAQAAIDLANISHVSPGMLMKPRMISSGGGMSVLGRTLLSSAPMIFDTIGTVYDQVNSGSDPIYNLYRSTNNWGMGV